MAKVKIQGHASGTGVITVTAPNTSTDRTITLPDGTGTLALTTGDDDKLPLAGGTMTGVLINKAPSSGSTTLQTFQRSDEAVAGEVKYDDTASTRGLQIGTTTQHDLTLKTHNTNRLQITYDGRGLSQSTAKAWCNFDGTGTAAIRDSHNVSSLTDHAQGDFTVTFSNNMGNTNYLASIDSYRGVGDTGIGGANLKSIAVGSIRFETVRDASTMMNPTFCNLLIFGD